MKIVDAEDLSKTYLAGVGVLTIAAGLLYHYRRQAQSVAQRLENTEVSSFDGQGP